MLPVLRWLQVERLAYSGIGSRELSMVGRGGRQGGGGSVLRRAIRPGCRGGRSTTVCYHLLAVVCLSVWFTASSNPSLQRQAPHLPADSPAELLAELPRPPCYHSMVHGINLPVCHALLSLERRTLKISSPSACCSPGADQATTPSRVTQPHVKNVTGHSPRSPCIFFQDTIPDAIPPLRPTGRDLHCPPTCVGYNLRIRA